MTTVLSDLLIWWVAVKSTEDLVWGFSSSMWFASFTCTFLYYVSDYQYIHRIGSETIIGSEIIASYLVSCIMNALKWLQWPIYGLVAISCKNIVLPEQFILDRNSKTFIFIQLALSFWLLVNPISVHLIGCTTKAILLFYNYLPLWE